MGVGPVSAGVQGGGALLRLPQGTLATGPSLQSSPFAGQAHAAAWRGGGGAGEGTPPTFLPLRGRCSSFRGCSAFRILEWGCFSPPFLGLGGGTVDVILNSSKMRKTFLKP